MIGPALSRGEPVEFVRELVRRDGTPFWCRMLAKAADPSHPMRGGTIWIVEDITERRRTEQALARRATTPRRPTAPRAPSSPTPATRSARRSTACSARRGWRAGPSSTRARRRQYLEQIAESAGPVGHHLRRARPVQDRGRQARHRARRLRPACPARIAAPVARHAGRRAQPAFALHTDGDVPRWVWGDPVRVRRCWQLPEQRAEVHRARLGDAARRPVAAARCASRCATAGRASRLRCARGSSSPSTQADQSTTRRFGGSGLGLSICHELARADGRRVGVDSTPGEGSFWPNCRCRPPEASGRDAAAGTPECSPLAGQARADGRGQPGQHDHRRGHARAVGRAGRAGQRRPPGRSRRWRQRRAGRRSTRC